jgi:circadian clock protein KaiB
MQQLCASSREFGSTRMKRRPKFKFRLYVAGNAPNGALAISNLKALYQQYAQNRHEIEIVDLSRDQKRALEDGILITPTLVKLAPAPVCRIVGSLSQERVVLQTLGLGTGDS